MLRIPAIFTLIAAMTLSWGKEGDVRLEVARQLAEKGEYDNAVQELRRYLSEHPDASEIYVRIGRLRAMQGNYKLAGENFKIALKQNPEMADAREGLAQAYEKTGDKGNAINEWRRLSQTSKDPVVRKRATAHLNGMLTGKESKSGLAQTATAPDKNDLPPVSSATPLVAPPSIVAPPVSAHPSSANHMDMGYSPAMDSGTSHGPEGIYTQKEFQEALRLYKEKKSDSALVLLRKSLLKSPGHAGAYYLGGVIRFERGEYAKAMFNLKRGLDYPDRGSNGEFYIGRIYQRQDRQNDAIEAFEKYLPTAKSEAGKRQAETYIAQLKGGEKEKSETAKVAESKPEGNAEAAGAEAGQLSSSLEKPVSTEPKSMLFGRDGPLFFIIPDNTVASGQKLMAAFEACRWEKYEKAENLLKETAMTYGGSDNAEAAGLDIVSIYLQLGLWENAQRRLSDYLGAGVTPDQAAKDSVKYPDAAHYLFALAELGAKNGERAEKQLLKIKPGSKFGPTSEEVNYRLAQAGELLKDSKKWAGYLEKAYTSTKNPVHKIVMAQKLGFLHSKFGSSERAIEYFHKAIQDCRDSIPSDREDLAGLCSESQIRLADLIFKKKDWKDALAEYKQFTLKNPDHKEAAWAHYQMANIFKATNNFESALTEYQRVIDNYPDSYWATQAKWKREDTIWQKEYAEVLD